jgi:hypothetical protein
MEHGKRYGKGRAISEFDGESNGVAVEFDAVRVACILWENSRMIHSAIKRVCGVSR